MEEEWRDIKDFPNYQVSNLGNVKSLNYNKTGKVKFLKPSLNKNSKYYQITLCKGGNEQRFYIHRLVAETFLPNPDNLPQVHHLDENKYNNCIENLCWSSVKDNNNYGTRNERAAKSNSIKQKNNPKKSTPIKCFDLETNETTYYPSIREAARQLNLHSFIIWDSIYKYNDPYKNKYIFTKQ